MRTNRDNPARVQESDLGQNGHQLLTPEEAAGMLRVKVSWIYQRTRRRNLDHIPFVKVGRYIRFREVDLLNYIDRRTVKT